MVKCKRKGRVAEGNDKIDSTIIKINSDLPSANADATFRRKVAYLIDARLII
ncbi:MAG: hypothetical protein LBB88_11860 [Planctomycetaceae bacterium]|nr:hypothetical protein [Planctomycetaceae bacterium]